MTSSGPGIAGESALNPTPTGTIVLPNLPTADPHVAGQLYSNLGIVTVSAG